MNNLLDLSHEVTQNMLNEEIVNGLAWTSSSVTPEKSILHIDDRSRTEILNLVDELRKSSDDFLFHAPSI